MYLLALASIVILAMRICNQLNFINILIPHAPSSRGDPAKSLVVVQAADRFRDPSLR
jgi:hypothetical protein